MILPMENTERMIFPGVGKYGIPAIKPEKDIRIDKLEWIPVNYALTAKDKATKGVHFYKDDYQFERFWNNPDKYISLLQQFRESGRNCDQRQKHRKYERSPVE